MTLWVVKGGKLGEREDRFLDHGLIGIGWDDMPDLTTFADRESLKAKYREIYPQDSEGRTAVQVGQLWAFAHSMQDGNLVVVPLKTRSQIAVGKISGPYQHTAEFGSDMRHVRKVTWLARDLPRTRFDKDLLFSFGSFLGVSTVTRHDAEARVQAVLAGKQAAPLPPTTEPVAESVVDGRDLAREAKDEIVDLVRARFKGHDLARLVDGVLRAKGYVTHVSPPGADGGVDIVAGTPPLGFGEPRIVVQVKSSDSPADVTVLRTLKGTMADFRAENGLLVSWGGFKDTVIREARNDFFKLRLWNQEDLLDAIFSEYERLDEELRAELPLKRIWVVTREALAE
jgi:restriction system protein